MIDLPLDISFFMHEIEYEEFIETDSYGESSFCSSLLMKNVLFIEQSGAKVSRKETEIRSKAQCYIVDGVSENGGVVTLKEGSRVTWEGKEYLVGGVQRFPLPGKGGFWAQVALLI